MRLPSQGTAVQTDGDFGPSDFHIEISGHAFSVLSKGLYSDPFRAIVRELCCNAWDAHVEAGTTDRPFELYLPNALAPVFKIRDYGVGLSEKGIREVYTTYFKSTKQQSDNMTGCFGLGSKSPYAYTKKFTIVSFYNGTRFHYNAIINEKGYPQIMKMAENETDEDNGLEVSFSVNEGDFWDFEKAAQISLRPFVVQPIVKGRSSFHVDLYPDDHLLEGKGWKLYRTLAGGNICTMGNVEYPIEATRSGFSSNAKKVLNLAMVVDFPLGSFEMTPSRESIQWTEFSVQNINDRLELIYDEIVEMVSKKIEESPTFWEATTNTHKFLQGTGIKNLGINPLWKGKLVKSTVEIPADKGITLFKFVATEARGNSNAPNSAAINKTSRIDPIDTTFYLEDFSGAEYRLGNYVRDQFKRGQHAYLVTVADRAALKLFCTTIGISEKSLVLTSTLPKRVRKGGGGSGSRQSRLTGSKARAFQFKMDGSGYSDSYWTEAEIDLDEPDLGVYVEISRWNPENTCIGEKASNLKYALKHVEGLGIALPDGGLVGIKTAHKSKFEEHENWKTIDQFIREKALEFWLASSDFRYAYEFFATLDHREKNTIAYFRTMVQKMKRISLLTDADYLCRFAKTFDRIYKLEKLVTDFMELVNILADFTWSPEPCGQACVVLPHGHNNAKDGLYSDRLYARYPLLRVVQNRSYSGFDETKPICAAIAEYLRMMDEKRGAAPSEPPPPLVNNSKGNEVVDEENASSDENDDVEDDEENE